MLFLLVPGLYPRQACMRRYVDKYGVVGRTYSAAHVEALEKNHRPNSKARYSLVVIQVSITASIIVIIGEMSSIRYH